MDILLCVIFYKSRNGFFCFYSIKPIYSFYGFKKGEFKISSCHSISFLTQFCISNFYWIVLFPLTPSDGNLFENPLISSIILTFIVIVVLIGMEQLENLETYMDENYPVSVLFYLNLCLIINLFYKFAVILTLNISIACNCTIN